MDCLAIDELLLAVAIITLVFIVGGGCVAILQLKEQKKQIRQNTFTNLLKDIESYENSYYRGKVRGYFLTARTKPTIGDIKKEIEKARGLGFKQDPSHDQIYGVAMERTIASFDRMAFFLLQAKEDNPSRKLTMKPPIWLKAMYKDFWGELEDWVHFRQGKLKEKDPDYTQEGYGCYFEEIGLWASGKSK